MLGLETNAFKLKLNRFLHHWLHNSLMLGALGGRLLLKESATVELL